MGAPVPRLAQKLIAMLLIATRTLWTGAIGTFCALLAVTAGAQALQPLAAGTGDALPAPWRVVGLPGNKVPLAQIDRVELDGHRVLRLRSDKSYGTASHALPPNTPATTLQWKWRVDTAVAQADLRTKRGDDAAVKVCAMFDLPLDKLGFVDRNLMRLARRTSGEYLPAATVCYVWDQGLPAGTVLHNAYTGRVRFMVLNSADTPLGQWATHSRDLAADFVRLFGAEAETVPPLLAIVVGADTDNTQGNSLAYVDALALVKQ